jgi:hypothetical protein
MRRRERANLTVDSLEERNLQSAVPIPTAPAQILPYIEQDNLVRRPTAEPSGIIAILIG